MSAPFLPPPIGDYPATFPFEFDCIAVENELLERAIRHTKELAKK